MCLVWGSARRKTWPLGRVQGGGRTGRVRQVPRGGRMSLPDGVRCCVMRGRVSRDRRGRGFNWVRWGRLGMGSEERRRCSECPAGTFCGSGHDAVQLSEWVVGGELGKVLGVLRRKRSLNSFVLVRLACKSSAMLCTKGHNRIMPPDSPWDWKYVKLQGVPSLFQ